MSCRPSGSERLLLGPAADLASIAEFMTAGDGPPADPSRGSQEWAESARTEVERVLVIDDDTDICDSLTDLLEIQGTYEVVTARSLDEARAVARAGPLAAALVDIKLERENGIDLIPELKKAFPDIVAIVMTAYHSAGYAVEALRSGADDFLNKPLDVASLLNTLKRALERQRLAADHRAMERRFRAIFEQSLQMLFILAPDGTILDANQTALRAAGTDLESLVGRPFWQTLWWASDPATAGEVRSHVERARAGQRVQCELRIAPETGAEIVVELVVNVIRGDTQSVEMLVPEARDVTDRKLADAQLSIAAKVFDNAAEGIVIVDSAGQVIEANQEFSAITGYRHEELVGRESTFIVPGLEDRSVYEEVKEAIRVDGRWRGEVSVQHNDGTRLPVRLSVTAERDDEGAVTSYIVLASDISDLKAAQQHLEFQANHDALTGLPNRTLFGDRLGQVLSRVDRHGTLAALLFVDIDRFKHVNDTLGHQSGDRLLIEIAKRLGEIVRTEDTLARLGGDEFVILLGEIDAPDAAERIARRALASISEPMNIGARTAYVSASIGIALCPQDTNEPGVLLSRADTAMFFAKRSGRNTYRFFDETMQQHAEDRMGLEVQLSKAIERGELFIQYQPKWNLDSLEVVGAEALIRWRHESLGTISPSRFIPVAEDMGLIGDIGDLVLREACRAVAGWQRAGREPWHVSVNIAPRQLLESTFASKIAALLEEFGIASSLLELEVTEGSIMQDLARAVATLRELRSMGIRIAIDDFGTGYSSLNQLRHLPVDTVKIDRSFLRQMENDESDRAVVASIISLANSLGLRVVAEGVETQGQLALLRGCGCHEAQGFLLARPLSEADFRTLLDTPG